mmetsp:Transcript_2243/g.4826  ORF Transcript_2243/g.4826 Transcript_2243/m.4826 type:complete len:273 (-) Transcript_2243:194-1012(-)
MRTPKNVAGALKRVNKSEDTSSSTTMGSKGSDATATATAGDGKGGGVMIMPQRPPVYGSRCQQVSSVQCWAHSSAGTRCTRMIKSREGEPVPIPYCNKHLESGDGALKVVDHPFAGKCLVARYDLPSKYRIVFWGKRGRCANCSKEDRAISFYPPDSTTGRNKDADGNVRDNYNGVLNPGGTGDLIQYAACPGPNERQNMRSTFQYWGVRNGDVGGLEFITLEPVQRNTQLCHWYGSGWWSARGVKRMDVGTKKHPAPLRLPKKSGAAPCKT